MDTTLLPQSRTTFPTRTVVGGVGLVIAAIALAAGAAGLSVAAPETASRGLSAEQIVIRGEVADRSAGGIRSGGLSAEQIVIRGEVADRSATQGSR